MILGTRQLLEMVNNPYVKLVENLSERELENPEGAGFDLRLGKAYQLSGIGMLGIDSRETPDIIGVQFIDDFDKEGDCECESLRVTRGDYFLVETMETVNMPDNLVAKVTGRTTLHRSGLELIATPVGPGYHGTLTFGLKNNGPATMYIARGARIAHIQFEDCGENVRSYEGQWQGGRVATDEPELQT